MDPLRPGRSPIPARIAEWSGARPCPIPSGPNWSWPRTPSIIRSGTLLSERTQGSLWAGRGASLSSSYCAIFGDRRAETCGLCRSRQGSPGANGGPAVPATQRADATRLGDDKRAADHSKWSSIDRNRKQQMMRRRECFRWGTTTSPRCLRCPISPDPAPSHPGQ